LTETVIIRFFIYALGAYSVPYRQQSW